MEKENPKLIIGAIIQARMGSTRLPGKVLMDIMGKPMLWHLINRLKFSKRINEVILAIPDTKENDALEKFAEENKIKYFRGSEEDVLSRYFKAAQKFKCDLIVRMTSDCPLIDPKIADLVIEKHLNYGADFTANFLEGKRGETLERTFLHGTELEVFNFSTLENAYQQAKEPYQREHVDPYIFEHPEIFKIAAIKNTEDVSYMRCTVDEMKDLELVREIYKRLYKKGEIFFMEDVVNLLKTHPELMEINKEVKRKQI
ncbi:glycosyltransferase family protein [Patescibacteria group bacterium]|nr:glycosyltransferase family protein [Patescibacteria group bacterium]